MATPLSLSQYELDYSPAKRAHVSRFGNLPPFVGVAGQKPSDSLPNICVNVSGITMLGHMRVQQMASPVLHS